MRLTIELEQETDGRWIAEIPELPGVLANENGQAHRARAVRAFAPIWMRPLMTIHGDTFVSDFLDLAGAHNVFAQAW